MKKLLMFILAIILFGNLAFYQIQDSIKTVNDMVIAKGIVYGMPTDEAKSILNSGDFSVTLGGKNLGKVMIIGNKKNPTAGILFEEKILSSSFTSAIVGKDPSLIIESSRDIQKDLLSKGYKIIYERSIERLNSMMMATFYIMEKENKLVACRYTGNNTWDVVMSNKEIFNNPSNFQWVFLISVDKIKGSKSSSEIF
jgi:hypothetical protein